MCVCVCVSYIVVLSLEANCCTDIASWIQKPEASSGAGQWSWFQTPNAIRLQRCLRRLDCRQHCMLISTNCDAEMAFGDRVFLFYLTAVAAAGRNTLKDEQEAMLTGSHGWIIYLASVIRMHIICSYYVNGETDDLQACARTTRYAIHWRKQQTPKLTLTSASSSHKKVESKPVNQLRS